MGGGSEAELVWEGRRGGEEGRGGGEGGEELEEGVFWGDWVNNNFDL